MSCRKRLTAHLVGSVFVALLGTGCAQVGSSPSTLTSPSPQQADIVDHALNAAKAARAAGDLNGAAAKLAYLVSVAPDNVGVLSEYAKVLTELGRPDDALAYFDKAKAHDPNDWKLLNAEGVAYDEKHDYASAKGDYSAALKLSPGEAVVLNNAARSRMAAGDLRGAETLLAEANSDDRAKGFLADTQSHLAALRAAQNPGTSIASATPQPLASVPTATPTPVAQNSVIVEPPAPAAPVATSAATASTAASVASPTQEAKAVPVAMNTTSSWTPPVVPATAPTVIDASSATAPAAVADTKPAQAAPPAPSVVASTTSDTIVPSLVAAKDSRVAPAMADAKPAVAAPGPDSSTPPARNDASTIPADNHRYYIRVGTYRSRKHARHVAARLSPRAVHVVRLTYHHHRYYRVWIANADRGDAEAMLTSVQALGYRHAHILAKLDTRAPPRLADRS
jgi:tetratricopeptide (TPR) repeat protein